MRNKERLRKNNLEYRIKNKEELRKKSLDYYQSNKDVIKEKSSNYQKTPKGIKVHKEACKKYRNTDKSKETIKKWYINNKEKISNIKKRQYEKNKDNHIISSYIRKSINDKNGTHWERLVDFTLKELKEHLESLFQPGMTWENQGKWHIDHIRPIASFNITSYKDKDFKKCWCLENLQPLWAKDNLSKGAKYK
jgi:hypothetical protein